MKSGTNVEMERMGRLAGSAPPLPRVSRSRVVLLGWVRCSGDLRATRQIDRRALIWMF
jgi:hypothetical protein